MLLNTIVQDRKYAASALARFIGLLYRREKEDFLGQLLSER